MNDALTLIKTALTNTSEAIKVTKSYHQAIRDAGNSKTKQVIIIPGQNGKGRAVEIDNTGPTHGQILFNLVDTNITILRQNAAILVALLELLGHKPEPAKIGWGTHRQDCHSFKIGKESECDCKCPKCHEPALIQMTGIIGSIKCEKCGWKGHAFSEEMLKRQVTGASQGKVEDERGSQSPDVGEWNCHCGQELKDREALFAHRKATGCSPVVPV